MLQARLTFDTITKIIVLIIERTSFGDKCGPSASFPRVQLVAWNIFKTDEKYRFSEGIYVKEGY